MPPDQTTLLQIFKAGDLTEFKRLADSLPDTSSDRLFLDALFDTDANSATASYSEFIEKCPGSVWAPYALERLSAWEAAKGNGGQANTLMQRLQSEYPAFKPTIDLQAQLSAPNPVINSTQPVGTIEKDSRKWSVQVGAFRNRKSAESVAKKAGAFGKVTIQEKKGTSGVINIVKVGVFNTKEEAESLASRIMKKSDLNAVVVVTAK